jgi:recyclin-1
MDEFMDFILGAIKDHGSTAVRVFPPASHVLLLFSERLSSEVVSEILCQLVSHFVSFF